MRRDPCMVCQRRTACPHRGNLRAIALGAALSVAAWLTLAQALDPTLPHRVIVGDAPGPAPMDRVDHARTGKASDPLPRRPRKLWRARVPGSIVHSLAVDHAGAIVVSSDSHLSQLSPRGKTLWTLRLGASPAATGPVITSSGARLVLTAEGEVVSVDASGKTQWRRVLPLGRAEQPAPPLPTSDGGCVVAIGQELFRLEPSGAVRTHTTLEERIQCVLRDGSALVVVTRTGNVFSYSPPSPPMQIGSLGGSPSGGALLAAARTLVAVVDSHRLVELNLLTGLRRLRLPDGPLSLAGPPAVLPTGATRLVSLDGLLLGHSATGKETLRVAVEPHEVALDGGVATHSARGGPPVIVDSDGWAGYARPGKDVGVASPDGRLHTAAGAACVTPVSLVPAGKLKMALGCASGIVWLVGD
jgi:hypothetical protein